MSPKKKILAEGAAIGILLLSKLTLGNGILTVPSPFTALDKNFVLLSLRAAEMCVAVDAGNTAAVVASTSVWTDEPDMAMAVRIEDICWVAFRATTHTTADWEQNLDPRMVDDVCYGRQCCQTRQGFRDAYVDVEYLDDLESTVRDCRLECCPDPANCSDEDEMCDVVLTGFSQGGAIAQVAAVFLQDVNPTTITFGQPPTMDGSCEALNSDRLYRFVNTITEGGDLKYDPVPFLDYGGVEQSGHLFVLAEGSTGVAYYKDENAPDISFPDVAVWSVEEVHSMDTYIDRLEAILDAGNFPVSLDGWEIGEVCSRGSECSAPHICGSGQCSRGEVGDSCWYEADCLPGNTCEGTFSARCEQKRPSGSFCNEADDCQSGICQVTWTGIRCG